MKKHLCFILIVAIIVGMMPTTNFKSEAANTEEEDYTAAYYETSGVSTELQQDDIAWLDATDTTNPLTLHGLLSQEGAPFARMDLTVAETIAESKGFSATSVYSHARESAGGRIRFTTTSPYLAIKAEFPMYVSSYANGMQMGKYGFDVYVENVETDTYEYYGTLGPSTIPTTDMVWGYEDCLEFDDESSKNIMIYFPITNELSEVYVGLDGSSYVVESEKEYEEAAPIVYYGSSITQGGMSTKPGNTYVNTIGRTLNYDYVNLGVWGSCKAETEFANYIAGLDMSAFVFDYDHNESDANVLQNKHYSFYQTVRASHPNIPILFVTRPDSDDNGLYLETKEVIKASYDKAVATGDTNVYYIDGETFFAYSADYLYDGVHPTDEGQAKMAEIIGAKLAEVLPSSIDAMSETVVLEDSFDAGTEWNANGRNWRLPELVDYVGNRTGVAELGCDIHQARALYNSSQMGDVHVEATVNVKEAVCHNGNTQYHMLIARAGADGASGGIGFGFKTLKDSSSMSLVVCQHQTRTNEPETIYYETETVYSHNRDYRLDLFVVGNKIIAKCDGKVIYADEIEGINTQGYCGIVDKRASTGWTDATKAGYFDDFSLSSISFDSYDVDGAIVCNPNGVGVAEIMQCSGDVSIASIEDCDVTISGYANKASGRYVGPVEVTCDGQTWITGIDQVVYVVEDVADAVTNLRDSRWNTLNSSGWSGDTPTWTDSGSGNVIINDNVNNYLRVNPLISDKQSEPYSNFYAEYSLAIDKVAGSAEEKALFDLRYFTAENSKTTDGAIARITYENGALSASMAKASGSYTYTSTTLTQGLAVGREMKIGLLMSEGVVKYFVNNQLVGTMTMGDTEGWLILKNNAPAIITATISDFLYVPLPEKQLEDIKVGCATKVQKGQALSTTVIPVYNWPTGETGVVTEGVSITGFDNTTLGKQKVTISYGGLSKTVETEVVDYEIMHADDFLDFNASEWSSASDTLTTKNDRLVMKATDSEVLLSGSAQENGYVEATFAIKDPAILTSANSTQLYPLTFAFRDGDSTKKTTIEARIRTSKDSKGGVLVHLQTLIRTNDSAGTVNSTLINGFEFGKQYTIRFTCIGNYFDVILNDTLCQQKTIAKDHVLATSSNMKFYISSATNTATIEIDDLVIAKYDAYTITDSDSITLPIYAASNTSEGTHERTSYLANEIVEVTANPGEGKQLKVGGLYYTEEGSTTKYSVTKRAANPGEKREIGNTFLLNMPNKDITLTDEYYTKGSQEANIGINGVSIREASEDAKAAIRYSSRVYQSYNDGTTDYTLKEVGTLLFKQSASETSVDETVLNACYSSEDGVYMSGDVVYGKKIKATRVQDICDEFVDYSLYLSYASGTTLGDQNYITYTYAVYVDTEGQPIVKFSSTPVTYSYNSVATQVGCDGL